MGSFNTTCFVSNQTIKPGQKVFVNALYQSHDYEPVEVTYEPTSGNVQLYSVVANRSSSCHPSAFWTPLSDCISAEYYDYGRVTIDNTPENLRKVRSLVAYLKKACPTVNVGKNEYHDVAFNLKIMPELTADSSYDDHVAIWNHIWEAAQEYRAFIVRGRHTALLGFSIMLQHAGNYMIAETEKMSDWDGNSLSMKSLLERKANGHIKRYKDFAETNKDESQVIDFVLMFADQELSRLSEFGISEIRLPIDMAPNFKVHDTLAAQYKTPADLVNPITPETLDKLYECLYNQLQFAYIAGGLNRVNIMFSPMIYNGQDYDNEIGKKYLNLVQYVADEIKKELDAEDDE